MKTNRSGQAAILAEKDYTKILKNVKKEKYKLLIHIARYTGERWGAIVQLKVEDVYYFDGKSSKYIPKKEITFKAQTRKADPNGKQQTRELPIHQTLKQVLAAYAPRIEDNGYLFPSPRKPGCHITMRNADWILRKALAESGIVGASTHSSRRGFITKLSKQGTAIAVIQKITGHKDVKALMRYIEVSPDAVESAISNL
ncbi:MAG: tyrosine-type recombinase/integrase [Calothrix sp. MO_167.B42]|nr:tyrosine-type recombinase/integrase [Calothrix sp. MO_167.B42]